MFRVMLSGIILCTVVSLTALQTREEKVRNDKAKVESAGYWIYNDLAKAQAEARLTRKPIMAVLRCVPCVECVKLDDDLIDTDDRLKPYLSRFVRVRLISTNGLDLSTFQFDTDQSFAVFFLNADGTILGRYGTRSSRTEWKEDVSIEGLLNAMIAALNWDSNFARYRDRLIGKRGPSPEITSPEQFPRFKDRYKPTLDYKGKVAESCIHCHMIGDAIRDLYFTRKRKIPENVLFPYPHPKAVGLILDPDQPATVKAVMKSSPADRAGFKSGDVIRSLNGQVLCSIADVQWILNSTPPEGAELKASVLRKLRWLDVTLSLPPGWRHKDDISWRASTWGLRRKALGGMLLESLQDEGRTRLQVPTGSMALLVKHVGEYPPHNIAQKAGFQKGDIVTSFDSRTNLLRETDVIAYSLQEKQPGDRIPVGIFRNGMGQTLTLPIPDD